MHYAHLYLVSGVYTFTITACLSLTKELYIRQVTTNQFTISLQHLILHQLSHNWGREVKLGYVHRSGASGEENIDLNVTGLILIVPSAPVIAT